MNVMCWKRGVAIEGKTGFGVSDSTVFDPEDFGVSSVERKGQERVGGSSYTILRRVLFSFLMTLFCLWRRASFSESPRQSTISKALRTMSRAFE